MWNHYILIGITVVATLVFLLVIVRIYTRRKLNKIKAKISCDDGIFSAHGKKNRFKIKKDNRFIFEVADGRIVSVKERQGLFYKKVVY